MRIDYKGTEKGLEIYLFGELDHHVASEAIAKTSEIIDENLPGALILDLAGVEFMDSSGIAVIMSARRRMEMIKGVVKVRGVRPQPMRVLSCAGVGRMVSII